MFDVSLRGMTALTNAAEVESRVNKSRPENLEYRPEIFKISQISRNIDFITSCLPENFPSLPIPGKISRFPEEFCLLPKQPLLELTSPLSLA